MTSKLTREQLHERARENVKALKMASRQTAFESAREEILADLQLAELALAAMAGEPVAVCIVEDGQMCPDGFGECDHSLPDGTHELYATPQPAPEHPEVLPCSVLLELGLLFGKGIKPAPCLPHWRAGPYTNQIWLRYHRKRERIFRRELRSSKR